MGRKRSPGEASRMLAAYEEINSDMDKGVRRQLAPFVLAPLVGTDTLDKLYRRPMGQTPFYHRSWMWYTAMATSNLAHRWDDFAGRKNSGILMKDCLIKLREQATSEDWKTLSRRLGTPVFGRRNIIDPHRWRGGDAAISYWTRGGVWDRRNNLTKIIVRGETLDGTRDHSFSMASRALTRDECKLIERELHNWINEELLLYPTAIREAVRMVRHRIPGILGWKRPATGYRTVSWFFQGLIPWKAGWADYTNRKRMPINRNTDITWLPPVPNS